jgi:hypothetical protein
MPPNDYAEALNLIVGMNIEPAWLWGKPKLRRIAGRRGYSVTQQRSEQAREHHPSIDEDVELGLIELLGLYTRVDTYRVREEVWKRLGIESQE